MRPYGSIASLRSAIYRQATERDMDVATASGYHGDGVDLYVQAWHWGSVPPSRIQERVHESVPAPDPLDHWTRPRGIDPNNVVDRLVVESALAQRADRQAAAVFRARTEVTAAGLDPEDQDLVEERLYCTCGLGNATEGKVHDPGCGAWG